MVSHRKITTPEQAKAYYDKMTGKADVYLPIKSPLYSKYLATEINSPIGYELALLALTSFSSHDIPGLIKAQGFLDDNSHYFNDGEYLQLSNKIMEYYKTISLYNKELSMI